MASQGQDTAPVGGAIYHKNGYRGQWRLEKAGPKWVTLRSMLVVSRRGFFMTHREPRDTWPNGWYRA